MDARPDTTAADAPAPAGSDTAGPDTTSADTAAYPAPAPAPAWLFVLSAEHVLPCQGWR